MQNGVAVMRAKFKAFVDAVEGGLSDKAAADLVGLSRSTVHKWLTDPKHRAIASRIASARARRSERWVQIIENAATVPLNNGAPGDWKAAAWLAERVDPDQFASRQQIALTGAGGGPVQIEERVETTLVVEGDEERLQKVMELLGRAGKIPQLVGGNGNGNGSDHQD